MSELFAESDDIVQRRFKALNNVIISVSGERIFSRVYNAHAPLDKIQPMRSVTKSVVSVLIGIAIDKGYIAGVDVAIKDVLPADLVRDNATSGLLSCSLKSVLTMSTGTLWRDGALGVEPMTTRMMNADHWLEFMLRLPVAPGRMGTFQYNTGLSHVLSAVLCNTVNQSVQQFASERLFKPLGVSEFAWEVDAQGLAIGGFGLSLSPLGMLRLGELYRRDGFHEGRQLVSAHWVRESTHSHLPSYGYQWWTREFNGAKAFYATGIGGQTIVCLPELEAVVVTTSTYAGRRDPIWELYTDYWVPELQALTSA